ncbi:hypothetical protein [Nocardia carnea]|uniref:hypothetical protein n=1 Tax=Nocardia carnea TaxID=37328 RepID=UPI0024542E13|nr:hypothetical protein [Nocardia carnea]
MNDAFEWATSHEWWQYLLTVYAVGYVLTVLSHMDTFRAILPKGREEVPEFAAMESEHPRLMAGLLSFVAFLAALFWPLDLLKKSWWRALVTNKRTLKTDEPKDPAE